MKIFCRHKDCIEVTLQEISDKYGDMKDLCDIGCGDGTRTILFDRYGRKIYGVDRIDWIHENIRKRFFFIKSDFINSAIPFDNQRFDIVMSFDVIEHMDETKARIMLREIHRVLRDNGVLIISTPNRNRLLAFFLYLFRLRKLPYLPDPATKDVDPYAYHVKEYTSSELEQLLKQEGMSVFKKHKVFYGLTGMFGILKCFSFPFYHNIIFECKKS
jgi:2-polyprenyl-3-methyl-5-hydroxy-6-metoxy-1,4-benzoquinol methylase